MDGEGSEEGEEEGVEGVHGGGWSAWLRFFFFVLVGGLVWWLWWLWWRWRLGGRLFDIYSSPAPVLQKDLRDGDLYVLPHSATILSLCRE